MYVKRLRWKRCEIKINEAYAGMIMGLLKFEVIWYRLQNIFFASMFCITFLKMYPWLQLLHGYWRVFGWDVHVHKHTSTIQLNVSNSVCTTNSQHYNHRHHGGTLLSWINQHSFMSCKNFNWPLMGYPVQFQTSAHEYAQQNSKLLSMVATYFFLSYLMWLDSYTHKYSNNKYHSSLIIDHYPSLLTKVLYFNIKWLVAIYIHKQLVVINLHCDVLIHLL